MFKYLGPREVQKLGEAMAALKNVSRDKHRERARRVPQGGRGTDLPRASDSDDYIRSVLTKALGDDKAASLIDRILQGGDTSGIEGLKWMDSPSVAELIKNEHPQIIATILVHLERDQACEVLRHFAERLRNDVMLRIATLDGIQPAALRELNDVLDEAALGQQEHQEEPDGRRARRGGDPQLHVGSRGRRRSSSASASTTPTWRRRSSTRCSCSRTCSTSTTAASSCCCAKSQSESLIVALKGASEELREKIFKNMSQRAAEMLREDLEAKGPVRVSEVEAEQKEILKIVRRLADEGQIALGGKGDEAYV